MKLNFYNTTVSDHIQIQQASEYFCSPLMIASIKGDLEFVNFF